MKTHGAHSTHQQYLIQYLHQISQTFCSFSMTIVKYHQFFRLPKWRYGEDRNATVFRWWSNVILWFASSSNAFACNTTFVSATSWEDIKQIVRIKLQVLIFDTSAWEDRMVVLVFIFAKHMKVNKFAIFSQKEELSKGAYVIANFSFHILFKAGRKKNLTKILSEQKFFYRGKNNLLVKR